MKFLTSRTKLVYAILALGCISALAFGGAYLKWQFDKEEDGIYYFDREPEVTSSVTETSDGAIRTEETQHEEGIGIVADSKEDAESRLVEIEQHGDESGDDVAHRTVQTQKKVIYEGGTDPAFEAPIEMITKLRSDEPFSESDALDLLNALNVNGDFSGEAALEIVNTIREDGAYTSDDLTIELSDDGVKVYQTIRTRSEADGQVSENVRKTVNFFSDK